MKPVVISENTAVVLKVNREQSHRNNILMEAGIPISTVTESRMDSQNGPVQMESIVGHRTSRDWLNIMFIIIVIDYIIWLWKDLHSNRISEEEGFSDGPRKGAWNGLNAHKWSKRLARLVYSWEPESDFGATLNIPFNLSTFFFF